MWVNSRNECRSIVQNTAHAAEMSVTNNFAFVHLHDTKDS